jgi:hypothetical protein
MGSLSSNNALAMDTVSSTIYSLLPGNNGFDRQYNRFVSYFRIKFNILGTMLSFVWPAYFHLVIKGDQLSIGEQKFNKFVIGLGIFICVVGVYYSSIELIHAIRYEPE